MARSELAQVSKGRNEGSYGEREGGRKVAMQSLACRVGNACTWRRAGWEGGKEGVGEGGTAVLRTAWCKGAGREVGGAGEAPGGGACDAV